MPTIVKRLATNVRVYRQQLGLSQSELARRAGVSKAALSQLENATTNPTVETVWALAQALGRPFTDLTGELDVAAATVVRADDGEWVPGDVIASRLLHRLDAPGVVEVYDVRLASGRVRRSAAHQDGLTEQLVVHSGNVRVGPADAPVVAHAGDSVVFPADVPHVYEAVEGDAGGLLLMHYPLRLSAGPSSISRPLRDPAITAAQRPV
jgi:transcriptional regulator with XRE-family HTH domain